MKLSNPLVDQHTFLFASACLLIPVVTVQCRDLSPAHSLVIEDPLCSFTAPTGEAYLRAPMRAAAQS